MDFFLAYMEYIWEIHGRYMGNIWDLRNIAPVFKTLGKEIRIGNSLANLWKIFGIEKFPPVFKGKEKESERWESVKLLIFIILLF